jgi:hypothetical protein
MAPPRAPRRADLNHRGSTQREGRDRRPQLTEASDLGGL